MCFGTAMLSLGLLHSNGLSSVVTNCLLYEKTAEFNIKTDAFKS